jgi:ribA/ribD-fused uncharacterized protein
LIESTNNLVGFISNPKNVEEKFIFYFGQESIFSHWFKCHFIIKKQSFCCVEQYIMYKKALLFHDVDIANKILNSSNPARHRYLGKQVRGFDKKMWQQKCKQFAQDGNLAKFSQNTALIESLLKTEGRSFAEASPYDRIWGIGLSISNPKIYDRSKWRGRNWAGEVLDTVRTQLSS